MYCKCQQPKKIKNEAHGQMFYVCAKSAGGCGQEIITGSALVMEDIDISKLRVVVFDEAKLELPQIGPCEYNCCGKPGVRSRQNTQYEDDERNFGTFCKEHQKDVDEYWDEMWKDVRRTNERIIDFYRSCRWRSAFTMASTCL